MIGDIAPKFSVVVRLTNNKVVSVEFDREVDQDVLADLAEIKNHPTIETSSGNFYYVKDSYDPKTVAEAISQSFEKKHGFKVRKRLNGSIGYKDVHCFTEVK